MQAEFGGGDAYESSRIEKTIRREKSPSFMMRKSVLFLYKNSAIQKEKTDEKVEKDIDIYVSIDNGVGFRSDHSASGGNDNVCESKWNTIK